MAPAKVEVQREESRKKDKHSAGTTPELGFLPG